MGDSPPARAAAAQQGGAAPTLRVGRPGRAPGGRPARWARAARSLEPPVRPRAGAGGRAVRAPQEAREPVPVEPPAAPVRPGVRDLWVPRARAVRPPREA